MSTQIDANGIKTIVHTSKFATDHQAEFLRRSGCDDDTIAYFYAATADSEKYAHQCERDRIAYCRSIGLPE